MGAGPKTAEKLVLLEWAKQVKAARQRLGLTQVQAAERCGIAQSTLSKIETGDYLRFAPAMVLRLCDGLDLDPRFAFDWPPAIVEIHRLRSHSPAMADDAA